MSSSNPNRPGPVTMRDVAKAAGVSRMTVSRALRADSPISADTRARILGVVREMNYVPDQMAGSLTTGRSGFVAVLVPSLNNLHFAETVQALTERIETIGRQILLGHTDYSLDREERLVEDMLKRRPEALVLSYDGHSERTLALLRDAGIPIIELWERPTDPINHTIGFSNQAAAAHLTGALIERGYRSIAFLGEADDVWTRGAARRRGFQDAMIRAGLSPHRLLMTGKPPLSIQDGADAAERLFGTFPDIDCVFCVSDAPAFGLMKTLIAQGRSVPDEIGIAGFGDFELSRFASPSITTVSVDSQVLGAATGDLIVRLLSEGDPRLTATQSVTVPTELMFRGSTR